MENIHLREEITKDFLFLCIYTHKNIIVCMLRNLEVGDKVKVRPFIGESYYVGKITKIGSAIIHVELLKIGDLPLVEPRMMRFSKTTFFSLGKNKMYELNEVMFGEHEKYEENH